MKKYFFIVLILLLPFLFVFNSCNLLWDKDTTDSISLVSTKPVVKLLGESIISMQKGATYKEEGIEAYVGDTLLERGAGQSAWEIESGEVDPNNLGFYVVTYKAVNGFNWATYAYRAVLVHDGTPYQQEEIGGDYGIGWFFETTIEKYEKDGYWLMSNVWDEEGVVFPIIFAEDNDGSLGIAPGVHETKGRYMGTGEFTGDSIKFILEITSLNGSEIIKEFGWRKD